MRITPGEPGGAHLRHGWMASVPTDPDLVIDVAAASVVRDGTYLLRDVTWRVELDERWVVLGPNGAGKTTLISLAAARMFPTSGTVHILGEQMGRVDVSELRTRIGLSTVGLHDRIPGDESVRDVVVTAAWSVVGRFREEYDRLDVQRAEGLLAQLGVPHLVERCYGTLSEGERKRVQIARALMTDPELLILDEPAAGLDLGGREDLVARLSALALDADAPALVVVTHHVEEIPPGFTHAIVLRGGEMIAAGLVGDVVTSETLTAAFGLPLTVQHSDGRFTARAAAPVRSGQGAR